MKKGGKNIQTVAYNGARTVYITLEKQVHITYKAKPRGLLHSCDLCFLLQMELLLQLELLLSLELLLPLEFLLPLELFLQLDLLLPLELLLHWNFCYRWNFCCH